MKNENKDEEVEENPVISILIYFLKLSFAVALLYVAGWELTWGENFFTTRDFLLNSKEFAIRFNDAYYGGFISDRFFDSVAISWISLTIAINLISPYRFFFFFSK